MGKFFYNIFLTSTHAHCTPQNKTLATVDKNHKTAIFAKRCNKFWNFREFFSLREFFVYFPIGFMLLR